MEDFANDFLSIKEMDSIKGGIWVIIDGKLIWIVEKEDT